MKTKRIIVDNIFSGWQPAFHFGQPGQYLSSLAIDPDAPTTDVSTDIFSSGSLRPVSYAKFSATTLDQCPLWITTTPKNTKTYVYGSGGDMYSYASALTSASETLERAIGSSSGNGVTYYNNYLYYARDTDVGRFDLSSTFTDSWWVGVAGLTALTNTTYPTMRHGVKYPNHPMCVHPYDNKLWIGDFAAGRGKIHYIRTKTTSTQGDTNDDSAYGALLLPFDYMPYDIKPYGNSLAIACSTTTDSSIRQGQSYVVFWDRVSPGYNRVIYINEPYTTALLYHNGILYGWSGNLQGGVRFWRYVGGDTVQTLFYSNEGFPPPAGATAGFGERVAWGQSITNPTNAASVFSYNLKSDQFPRGTHNVANSSLTATSADGLIGAIKYVQQGASLPRVVIGGTDGTNVNLDKQSTTYGTHIWRSTTFNIGQQFTVKKISIRLAQAIASNMTITPKLFIDNETVSQVGTTINSTNYTDSQKQVTLTTDNFSGNASGNNNFYLELKWTGSALLTVLLPIIIDIDIYDDQQL